MPTSAFSFAPSTRRPSVWLVAVLFVVTAGLTACKSNSPSEIVRQGTEAVAQNDVEAFAALLAQSVPASLLASGLERSYQIYQSRGGVASVEILSEDIDGDQAQVRDRITFEDGTTSETTSRLVRVGGAWRLAMN
ncbi:MAG: hypothetical protein AAGF99_12480 [Bacteroidota bacterium]